MSLLRRRGAGRIELCDFTEKTLNAKTKAARMEKERFSCNIAGKFLLFGQGENDLFTKSAPPLRPCGFAFRFCGLLQ